mgnify:CR=1 FL=1
MGKLFGTDGVRGIVGKDLTCELALKIGMSVARTLKKEMKKTSLNFLIGSDTRISADMLKSGVISGFLSEGCNIIDTGIIPTPAISYLITKYNLDGGFVISASHNPVEYNGIKVFNSNGYKLDDEIEKYIEDYKAFQYYKLKCEQCKKELYLNLGQYYDARYEFLRYRSNIWRTDESERDELINLRKENLRKKTDNKYLQEWNELCVRKEAQNLERAKKLCAQEANRVRNTYGKIAIGFLSFILDPGLKLLKYRVNILNLIKYVSNSNKNRSLQQF